MSRRTNKSLALYLTVCMAMLAAATTAQAQKQPSKTGATPSKSQPKTQPPATQATVATAAATAPKLEDPSSFNFMTKAEAEIIDEMNLARTDPQKYVAYLEEFRKYYEGNRLSIPGRKKVIVTNEGTAAVDEAINFLKAQTPLPRLDIAKGVCLAARDHATDLSTKGVQGHRGSDGSTPNARVDRYGSWEAAIGETIVYEVTTPRQVIIALIIDDGVPSRGHRRNIFDPNYKITGISISEPASFGSKCVIDYVGGFKEGAANNK